MGEFDDFEDIEDEFDEEEEGLDLDDLDDEDDLGESPFDDDWGDDDLLDEEEEVPDPPLSVADELAIRDSFEGISEGEAGFLEKHAVLGDAHRHKRLVTIDEMIEAVTINGLALGEL